uniref:Leucine rich repeat protein n=1 Tax=Musca domestica TaxID=7370 RepID=A0A1I8MFK5_MUSDO
MSFKCQIFRKRLTVFNNVLELSCDVRIIILCYFIIATVLPSDIKCAKLPNPQIRLLINDEDLLHEKTSRHEAAAAAAAAEAEAASAHHADNSGEHFNLYRSELKRLSYETIHRILRDENEPSYRREETELRYYQKRSPPAYEDVGHQLNKRSTTDKETQQQENIALNYSKRNLQKFVITDQLAKELAPASSLDLSDNHLCSLNLTFSNHLQSLKLSNNSFTAIPITGKSQLKTLNLNRNNIISPSSLESNIYLRQLYLSNNGLENILPLNLSLLKNLETLDISCNSLKNLETSFFPERMHNLKHLNMAHNQLGAIYRETFYNLLSLNTLLLGHNNITDIDYETFLALPNLQYLDLSYNALKGKSIRALQGITGLVALNIAYNPELGPYMQEFVASWSLKELDASGTGLCQIPAALAQSVRSLKLTHNWLKVINCGDLDSYPLLQYLDLSHSHIEQIEDDALGRLEILEILMLDHNNLKKIPQSLPVSLEHLFLQYNNIMDIQSQSFQGLTSLKTLDLSNNKLLYLPDITLPKLQTLNLQSSEIRGCADQRPQRQDDKSNVIGKTPTNQTSHEPEEYDVETTTAAAATTMSTTSSKAVVVATTTATPVVHKHEPLQLHVKDRHLIGTPLLMHKGDNLMVATDELIKANPQDSGKRSTGTTKTTTTSTPPSTTSYGMASTAAAAAATGPQTALPAEAKTVKTILAKSQHSTKPFKKNHDDDDDNVNDMLSLRHHPQHEPFEHKGETIKVKDYSLYAKKSNNADMAKTKKPSLIMKKMTIVTKQHEVVIADSPASATTSTTTISPLPDATNSAEMVNPLNERQFSERHFQELRPQHNNMAKHSTVNTPVNGNSQQAHHLMHEPQTFQHEHELLMQQILHDEQQQQQQQQHEKLSQSEQWSDLRKANNKDNHPGLILLVSSGLFVVLLLGLMHVYRCDVPWRRSSPAHHLRPHQRHNASLDDDVHSFLSYNEGMQKWHHSTRLEAPYSSPLHNLHVRELQKTSATEKPATIKTSSSYAETMAAATNRHHILPRSNSQSSSTTTRTTSPSSSAMLDDETFYIEMTPPAGQLAQALHSELLPMELLNLAQTKTSDIKETTVGDLQTSLQDDCVVLTSSRGQHIAPSYKASSSMTMETTKASLSSSSHRDLLISSTPLASSAAAAAATSSSAASASNSQKPLYNSRKFGLW